MLWERHVGDDIAMASKLRSYQPAGCLRGVSVRYLVRTPRAKMLFWICFRLHLPACVQISCFGTKKLMHTLRLQSKPVEICKNHQAIKDAAQFTMDSWQDLPLGAEDTRSQCFALKKVLTKPFSPESQLDPGTYLEVKRNQPKHLHKAKKERRGQGVRISSERRLDGSSGTEQEMSRQLWDRAAKKVVPGGTAQNREREQRRVRL